MRRALFAFAAAASWTAGQPSLAAVQFTVTDLGPMRNAYGINESGQVAGQNHRNRASIFDGTGVIDLGTLGGLRSYANDINDLGQLTGSSYLPGNPAYQGATISHAYKYDNGVMIDIGTLGGQSSYGEAINNLGQITGSAATTLTDFRGFQVNHAFLYTGGDMIDLGSFGGSSVGRDVNEWGQVTGSSAHGDGFSPPTTAFLYTSGVMTNLGTLLGSTSGYSAGLAINDLGEVTGISSAPGGTNHAFLYRIGVMIDLGSLGGSSSGADINRLGQVVGSSAINAYEQHAFVYNNGVMADLNSLIDPTTGWTLQYATAINDEGQIAGFGYHAQFGSRAFLLNPSQGVPEPSAWAMMILGFGFVGKTMRRSTKRYRSDQTGYPGLDRRPGLAC